MRRARSETCAHRRCLHLDAEIPGTKARLLYCTPQVQTWRRTDDGFALKLYAHPGVEGEAAFTLPARPAIVAVDNTPPLKQEWYTPMLDEGQQFNAGGGREVDAIR